MEKVSEHSFQLPEVNVPMDTSQENLVELKV